MTGRAPGDGSGVFGSPPWFAPPPDPQPIVQSATWPWSDPLEVILRAVGCGVEEALADPGSAREVARLWHLVVESRRLSREREEANRRLQDAWRRRQLD